MADKVHCIRKTLRLMPEEAKMLAKKACDNGMNEAEYIRLLISQKPNDYPEVRKILKELINEVNRIGININQIVFNNTVRYGSIRKISVRCINCRRSICSLSIMTFIQQRSLSV